MKEIRQASNDRRLRKKEAAEKPACSLRTADRLGQNKSQVKQVSPTSDTNCVAGLIPVSRTH